MRDATKPNAAPLQCLMCGGLQHRPIFNEFGIDILRCRACQHVFSSFRADPHYDGFWGEGVAESDLWYWQEARSSMYQDFCERFLMGRSGRLLDMGCGLGFFLHAMAPYATWEAYGCEISPVAVRYARETLGLTNVICSRLEEADVPQSSFDLITMWDVIDHIPRPDPLLRRCHALLREGGICFMRTPNVSHPAPEGTAQTTAVAYAAWRGILASPRSCPSLLDVQYPQAFRAQRLFACAVCALAPRSNCLWW